MKALPILSAWTLAALFLSACAEREIILPGERLSVRDALNSAAEGDGDGAEPLDATRAVSTAITLPAQVNHAAWTHRGGTASHKIAHPALGSTLARVWASNIGSGDSRKARITADPVVAEGRIFTQDSRSRVMAHSTEGRTLWSVDMTPARDRNSDASGGGLAYGGGRLFVTTGFGELSALDPASGAVLWRQRFDAPVAGAPTVLGDLVYVASRDNRAFAVKADNGRLTWQLPGTPAISATVNGSAPAVTERVAIFPFGSAELVAALRQGGIRVWAATLSGERRGRAYAGITDVASDPVVDGSVIYAASSSGRLAAMKSSSGERIWTATEGALSPVWPVGGSVFLVSEEARLLRLDAETGDEIWAVDLPYYKKQNPRRQEKVFSHYGPILAGGRLIVASDDGKLRSFSPQSGALISEVDLPGGATTNPVVVNRTLYVVTGNGQLHAFR